MERSGLFLLIVGALIIVGMALSFYGSQIITEDLITEQSDLISGETFEIFADLDPIISESGVFVVQTTNFEENAIHVKIFDPLGSQLVSKTVESESFEDRFEILSSGEYRINIENTGSKDTTIFLAIGHLPDTSKLSVGITGFYILIVAMIGIAGLVVLAIKNKRKNKLS
jgi:hypothetical protein